MYIYPYKNGSKSVAALAEELGARVIKLEGSKFKGSADKIVINWGNSMTNEEIEKANVLNSPKIVALATNKLTFFNAVRGQVKIPEFTVDRQEAKAWLDAGKKIIVREKLNGHSGEGIVVIEDDNTWQGYEHSRAKLYVQYIPKKDEYRVHVVDGKVIDVQRKAIHPDSRRELVNFTIRNHHNGFIYVREGVIESCPEDVTDEAVRAVGIVGLHFGAVDVIWNEYRKKAYVLEINTAPGLEGQTVQKYKKALGELSLRDVAGMSNQPISLVTSSGAASNRGAAQSNPIDISALWAFTTSDTASN